MKILIVFAGVLLFNRLRVPLGFALLAGGVGVELWAGKSGAALMADFGSAVTRPELWLLLLNIALIAEVGQHLAAENNARTFMDAARRWGGKHGQALSLVMIPAAIGLVPMPGGALFSAPLVGETLKQESWSPAWKSAVNYWFRHIMEYWWPLYPVVIVTLSIFPIETWEFMAVQVPFTLVSLAAGYFFLLRPFKVALITEVRGAEKEKGSGVFRAFLPVGLIVGATLLLPDLFQRIFPAQQTTVAKMLAMFVGLLASLTVIMFEMRRSDQALFRNFFSPKTFTMLMTLAGVMVFQSLLESSGLLPAASEGMARTSVPVVLIIALLPFVAGLVTGIAIGFAGTAFPLVFGFVGLPGGEATPLATLALAFSMGYAGMMLSPVHLCFLLTKEYFMAPFAAVYRHLVPCVAATMITGVLLHILLSVAGL